MTNIKVSIKCLLSTLGETRDAESERIIHFSVHSVASVESANEYPNARQDTETNLCKIAVYPSTTFGDAQSSCTRNVMNALRTTELTEQPIKISRELTIIVHTMSATLKKKSK